ncbi:MAG: hypothetical protein VX335_02255 [Pseudomonadota bacterium]|nr:hypothetical protein [Pseudomonadota bacterium]
MEAKYLYRVCLLLTAVMALSLFLPAGLHSSANPLAIKNTNMAKVEKNLPYPFQSFFHNIQESFASEIKSTGAVEKKLATNEVASSQYNVLDEIYKDNAVTLPPNVVYGVINSETMWNIKVGPFTDPAYSQELSRYLLAQGYQLTLKSDASEHGTDYTIFISFGSDKNDTENEIINLANKYHIQGILTKNYS